MSEIRTLGPWLERFLTEHIVTERNLARNTQKSYRDTFALLLPFLSSKLRKSVDRLAGSRSYVQTGAAIPRLSRRESRLLRTDPQSASDRPTRVCPFRWEPRPGLRWLVRPHPSHFVEEGDAATDRMADED